MQDTFTARKLLTKTAQRRVHAKYNRGSGKKPPIHSGHALGTHLHLPQVCKGKPANVCSILQDPVTQLGI